MVIESTSSLATKTKTKVGVRAKGEEGGKGGQSMRRDEQVNKERHLRGRHNP